VVVIGLLAWAMLAGRPASATADPDAAPPATEPSAAPSAASAGGINLRRTVTVEVVQKTKDAVVNISAKKLVAEHVRVNEFFQTFDTGQVVHVPANSLGSGFIVHRDGYVVTNNHVIDHARQISVELADGRTLPADVVGADPDADLAVLRIHSATPLPTLAMGDSGDLMIGEPVIAVGNPLGLSHSVSTGIVSALHRDINPEKGGQQPNAPVQAAHGEEAALHDLIQTDAAINPGNSGGPLLNAYGEVIAINTAIRSDAQNIGFAIPIDRLRDLIPELMNPSQVTKVDVPLHLAERRSVVEPATVVTRLVTTGDHSTELATLDGRHPTDIVDAYAALLGLRAGQPITVGWADGHRQQLATRATPLPDAVVQARQRFGLSIEAVTPMLADRYHLAQEDGLFVTAVDRNTPAAEAGLQPGDVIVSFGRVHMATLDDFGALAGRLPASGKANVWVIRGTQLGYVPMKF
jgi:serine protease Do